MNTKRAPVLVLCLLFLSGAVLAQAPASPPPAQGQRQGGQPPPPPVPVQVTASGAVIDLMTPEGVTLVKGQWKYSDARIVEAPVGRGGIRGISYAIVPQAGVKDFDDSGWLSIQAPQLRDQRTGGGVSFNWYRIKLTIPDTVETFNPTGAKAFFKTVIDDYAEVWVNGVLPRNPGGISPNLISGFNVPNRVPLGTEVKTGNVTTYEPVKPGDVFTVAVFGLNGPISEGPGNRIFVREAKLEFEK